jgi:uncharacterized membrane protein
MELIGITKKILTISVVALLLDYLYLSSHQSYFNKVFRKIQGDDIKLNLIGAGVCYLFIVLSIFYFGFVKGLGLLDMFILGIFIYGIYELTNFAVFKHWPLYMVLVDTLWGGILYMSTFSIAYYLTH